LENWDESIQARGARRRLTYNACSVLHVLNGDSTRMTLARSGLPGDLAVWADVLHDGPTPANLSPEEFRRIRASHLERRYGASDALETLAAWDTALERYDRHDEVVFWFEHDLFDQLILLRHLHWLASLPPGSTRFSLICIDRFAGIERFAGLGQLGPDQLATLFPKRVPIQREQVMAGQRGWNLYCAPDPRPLQDWLDEGVPALPFLSGALRRHFEDYPSAVDGLSRTERQMLAAVAEGHATFSAMFRACQALEERVYMGDATFWAILRDLDGAIVPLVQLSDNSVRRHLQSVDVELTPAGEQVLAGRADHAALNGVDRWMGGVHVVNGNWLWTGERVVMNQQRAL
jgi:hypothetical protein